MLAAGAATGDKRYTDYVLKRHQLLADLTKTYLSGRAGRPRIRRRADQELPQSARAGRRRRAVPQLPEGEAGRLAGRLRPDDPASAATSSRRRNTA
jgi:hypothetical protein